MSEATQLMMVGWTWFFRICTTM